MLKTSIVCCGASLEGNLRYKGRIRANPAKMTIAVDATAAQWNFR
jgi:hypothetical protein